MTPAEVGAYAESLAGVKRTGTAQRPAWYVRDRLLDRLEAHHQVEAYLDHASVAAVQAAIDLAWDDQRH